MTIYCTYLTIYSGNKLPPFYIGSTSTDKISKGYKGSVRSKMYKDVWEYETKHNPSLFRVVVLSIHNNRKHALVKENYFQKKLDVVKNPLYANRSYAQINGSHGAPNGPTCYGRVGTKHPMYGKRPHNFGKTTPEHIKQKISSNHHDVSGANNPRALTYQLISPSGIVHTVCGELESFCKQHFLGIALLKKHKGSIVPILSKHATSPMSRNTIGWKLCVISWPSRGHKSQDLAPQ